MTVKYDSIYGYEALEEVTQPLKVTKVQNLYSKKGMVIALLECFAWWNLDSLSSH